MKEKIKEYLVKLNPSKLSIQRIILLLHIMFFLISSVLKKSLALVHFILLLLEVVLFIGLGNKKNDKEKDSKYVKMFCYSSAFAVGQILFSKLFTIVLGNILSLTLTIVIVVFVRLFLNSDKGKEVLECYLTGASLDEKNEIKDGDAILGIDKNTGKPVFIPLTDRYLHTLVLGPTGCGKTSLILTPMVLRDINNPNLGVIVIDPKGDFAEKAYAMAVMAGRKDVVYFNPMLRNCPYFNPLVGPEDDVIENIVTTFKAFDTTSSQFFQDNNENLLRRAIKVVKRLYGDDANFKKLSILINNTNNAGKKMVVEFKEINCDPDIQKDNEAIAHWFIDDYFTGITGERGSTKTYEQSSGVRNQISKLISNSYVDRVLNPPDDVDKDNLVDFNKLLESGGVVAISTAQGTLRNLSSFLGYFIILSLESAVFKRPGNEHTRRGVMLYIDEFQKYANDGFADMLTQGRSYRVASILATQTRKLINGGNAKSDFLDVVSTNARNKVVFPGASSEDATYYSNQFGQVTERRERISVNAPKLGPRWMTLGEQKETISIEEREKPRFSATDVTYQKFKEAIVSIIFKNEVQYPTQVSLEWIPYEINVELGKIVDEFNKKYLIDTTHGQSLEPPVTPAPSVLDEEDGIADPMEEFENDDDEEYVLSN